MSITKFKDSGARRVYKSGAQRDRAKGKGRCDLLPPRALIAVSKIYEGGAVKYGDRNWENGYPLSWFIDSCVRHILKHMQGMKDEPHEDMALWNLMGYIETKARIEEGVLPKYLNDVPWLHKKKERSVLYKKSKTKK